MGKCLKIILMIVFFIALSVNCYAIEESTYKEFLQNAPEEFSESDSEKISEQIEFSNIFNKAVSALAKSFKGCLSLLFSVCGLVIMFTLLKNIQTDNSPIINTMSMAVSVAVVALSFSAVSNCVSEIGECIESTKVFCSSAIPIILGLCITSGNSFSGSVFSTSVSFIATLLETVSSNILMPLSIIYLSFAIVNNFSSGFNVIALDKQIKKFIKWVIGAFITLFSFSMSLQSFLSSSSDSMLKRSIKSAVGSFVPVVGSTLSSSIDSVFTIASNSKTVLAVVGIVVIISIFLPVLANCITYGVSLSAANILASFLKHDKISGAISSVADTFYLLSGICAACVFMMILSFLLICINLN